jgi:hypothetical protein
MTKIHFEKDVDVFWINHNKSEVREYMPAMTFFKILLWLFPFYVKLERCRCRNCNNVIADYQNHSWEYYCNVNGGIKKYETEKNKRIYGVGIFGSSVVSVPRNGFCYHWSSSKYHRDTPMTFKQLNGKELGK